MEFVHLKIQQPLALYAMKLSPNFKPQKKVEEILKVKKIKDTTFTVSGPKCHVSNCFH